MGWFTDHYGPWALVAGASEGLGEAFAFALARRKLDVILLARREDKLRALAAEITSTHGVEVHTIALDLADPNLAARLREGIGAREVGLLVYNAAYSQVGGFLDQSLEVKLRILDVNCRGPIVLCHELGTAMRARGRGGILLMGSLAGLQGSPRLATYAASKAFDLVLAESLWGELREHGVDVLACVAGSTRTPGFEKVASTTKAPVMQPAQVAEEAIEALGGPPSMVPGLANKLATMLMSHLSRRQRILIMKSAMKTSQTNSDDNSR